MRSFIEDIIKDIRRAVPLFDCKIDETTKEYNLNYKSDFGQREYFQFPKDLDTEVLLPKMIETITDFVCDAEPYGIVVTPKIDCEFKVSDPFFEDVDDCSGGLHPSYSMKECANFAIKVADILFAIGGYLEKDVQKSKSGIYIRLHNKFNDIRISLRMGSVASTPILIVRIGDYRNFKISTQVIDGTKENGKSVFMAVETVNALLPQMIDLSKTLAVERNRMRIKSEKFVEQIFKDLKRQSELSVKQLPMKKD